VPSYRTNPRHSLKRNSRLNSRRSREQGVVITLVAVFMLAVLGAMAAISIDVTTFYTARSEAQLAADSAALAGARVLANSGATSDNGTSMSNALTIAQAVALQVAEQNQVGGANVTSGQVAFGSVTTTPNDPTFTVTVTIPTLPTFFARMLGTKFVKVAASAKAEAYNPSSNAGGGIPVSPMCVKPWLLPNIDPTQTGAANPIFTSGTGAILNRGLLGKSWPSATNSDGIYSLCNKGDCSIAPLPGPSAGAYYPGAIDANDFPAPASASIVCTNSASTSSFTPYQLAVAGCVQRPISCGTTVTSTTTTNPTVNIDVSTDYTGLDRDTDTVAAAECMIHYNGGALDTDSVVGAPAPTLPFDFHGGTENPVAGAAGQDIMVSDSLVTIPVIDYPNGTSTPPTTANPVVTVIGFLQVFLNPQSAAMPMKPSGTGSFTGNEVPATIINMVGCGTNSTTTTGSILGNGASPVAVRLISTP
jgi:Flp pilus assembly protein TadG